VTIMGSCHCDKTAFRIDTEMPAQLTRCDNFDAALSKVVVIDGKHLW